MDSVFNRFGLDFPSVRLAYLLGRDQGRKFLRGALVVPGIRKSDLEKIASKNGDAPAELIGKRDAMLDAVIEFMEEFVNLDDD